MNQKIAIISGAAGDIGFAICEKFAKHNITVIGLDINKDHINYRQNSLGSKSISFKVCDISNYNKTTDTIISIVNDYGIPSILVNCAGITKDKSLLKMTLEDFNSVIDVNLTGSFNCIKAVSNYFKDNNYGKIVNISSINALRGKFGQVNYTASKAGLIGLTKTAAIELGKYNINVNAIAPGFITTSMTNDLPEDIKNIALKETLLNRLGEPSDIAELVYFLVSDISRHITGEIIKIDGGQYL